MIPEANGISVHNIPDGVDHKVWGARREIVGALIADYFPPMCAENNLIASGLGSNTITNCKRNNPFFPMIGGQHF